MHLFVCLFCYNSIRVARTVANKDAQRQCHFVYLPRKTNDFRISFAQKIRMLFSYLFNNWRPQRPFLTHAFQQRYKRTDKVKKVARNRTSNFVFDFISIEFFGLWPLVLYQFDLSDSDLYAAWIVESSLICACISFFRSRSSMCSIIWRRHSIIVSKKRRMKGKSAPQQIKRKNGKGKGRPQPRCLFAHNGVQQPNWQK